MIQTDSAVIITLDLETWLKITAHPSIKRHLVREIYARLGQGERKHALDN